MKTRAAVAWAAGKPLEIEELELEAFPLVVRSDDFRSGMEMLLQAYGIGPIKANILLLNWLEEAPSPDRENDEREYGRNMREALRLGFNIVALSASDEAFERVKNTDPEERRINVWWDGTSSSRLALLLAHLMRRTELWHDSVICVHAEGSSDHEGQRTQARLEERLDEMRIDAEIRLVDNALDDEQLSELSSGGAVTFIPMRLSGDRPTDFVDQPLDRVERSRAIVALVIASGDIRLISEPEDSDQNRDKDG